MNLYDNLLLQGGIHVYHLLTSYISSWPGFDLRNKQLSTHYSFFLVTSLALLLPHCGRHPPLSRHQSSYKVFFRATFFGFCLCSISLGLISNKIKENVQSCSELPASKGCDWDGKAEAGSLDHHPLVGRKNTGEQIETHSSYTSLTQQRSLTPPQVMIT